MEINSKMYVCHQKFNFPNTGTKSKQLKLLIQGEQAIVPVKDLDSDDKFRKQTNAMGNAVASGYKKAMQAAPSMVKGAGIRMMALGNLRLLV